MPDRKGLIRDQFDTVDAFYAGRPERQFSPEADYGVCWHEPGRPFPVWRVSYVKDTGEVYAVRQGGLHAGEVQLLGVVPADETGCYYATLDQVLEGWEDGSKSSGHSLEWVRGRLTGPPGPPMMTIDQAEIAGPGFPRSQEWWSEFVPPWAVAIVMDTGLLTIAPRTGVAGGRGRGTPGHLVRDRELALLRWARDYPELEAAIVEDPGERCRCWRTPAGLHNGHCCFSATPYRVCHRLPDDMRKAGKEMPA